MLNLSLANRFLKNAARTTLMLGVFGLAGCEGSLLKVLGTGQKSLSSDREPLLIGPVDRLAPLYISEEEKPVPLYVMLHGYGSSGQSTARFLNIQDSIDKIGGHLLVPEGRTNGEGRRFWDATPACCEAESSQTDQDEIYLKALIEEAKAALPGRIESVTLVGYSNGSFMSQRMACRQSGLIDRVISFVGAGYASPEECQLPGRVVNPVTMIHIHGEWDSVVFYGGGTLRGASPYPSAPQTLATWAILNGCSGEAVDEPRSLELSFEGVEVWRDPPPEGVEDLPLETDAKRYQNCRVPTMLLTMRGLAHIPRYRPDILEFLVSEVIPKLN